MQVPKILIMLGNRRNLIFRVAIVFNIALLLYAAMHYSGNSAPDAEWVPITADGIERAELRYFREDLRNETDVRLAEPTPRTVPDTSVQNIAESSIRNIVESSVGSISDITETIKRSNVESSMRNMEESTSLKSVPSTLPSVNKTISTTVSNTDTDKFTNDTLDIVDENTLSDATLMHLRSLLRCNDRDFTSETVQRGEFWVLKNYARAEHGPVQCHESITYTTHAGFEFLDNVPPLVKRWMAPVSIAIHAPETDMALAVNSIRYLRDCIEDGFVRQFVTFHIFFSNKHIPSSIPNPDIFMTPFNCTQSPPYIVDGKNTFKAQKQLLYPINVARNIARDAALTHFILPSDIELYPSPYLIPKFLNMIARNEPPLSNSTNPRVFPISLFEVDTNVQPPWSKTELQDLLKKKKAIPFHKNVCRQCHSIPRDKEWMAAKETDEMKVFYVGKRRGYNAHWEPIFIGTHKDPHYDERLSWEGKKDKMTQGYILCVKDYDFMILNNAFLIHKPGIKHYKKNKTRDQIAARQNKFIAKTIMPEFKKLYGTKSGCQL